MWRAAAVQAMAQFVDSKAGRCVHPQGFKHQGKHFPSVFRYCPRCGAVESAQQVAK